MLGYVLKKGPLSAGCAAIKSILIQKKGEEGGLRFDLM